MCEGHCGRCLPGLASLGGCCWGQKKLPIPFQFPKRECAVPRRHISPTQHAVPYARDDPNVRLGLGNGQLGFLGHQSTGIEPLGGCRLCVADEERVCERQPHLHSAKSQATQATDSQAIPGMAPSRETPQTSLIPFKISPKTLGQPPGFRGPF